MAALTEEQLLVRDQVQNWVREKAPVSSFRRLRDSHLEKCFLPETWQGMVEMGWPGILIPEEYGGTDLGCLTFGLILEETGRQLVASPLFASAFVGASVLLTAGSREQKQAFLPGIAEGSRILTLAVDEGPRHVPAAISMQAKTHVEGFVLQGKKTLVAEGLAATDIVLAARTSGRAGETKGISLFLLPADAKGVKLSRLHTLDSRGYANLALHEVHLKKDALLGKMDEGFPLLAEILDRAAAGTAAEMLGTAAAAFDMTLEYLKTREQFGRVIGSFQALGHRAADLFMEMELARSCVEAALQAFDAKAKDTAEAASLAKARAGDFLFRASNELIQIHGGIGMTDEFDAGLYLKRARAQEAAFGNRAFHKDRYARLLGY